FSTAYGDPLRVEFLGETVESLRLFDPASQKSTAKMDRAFVLPAREYLRTETGPEALAPIPADAEWRAPDLYVEMQTLFEYFASRPLLTLEQPAALKLSCSALWERIDDGYLRHSDKDEATPYPSPERLFLTWKDITDRTADWTQLALEPLAEADASWHPVQAFPAQSPASAGLAARGTPFSQTLSILDRLREGYKILLVART